MPDAAEHPTYERVIPYDQDAEMAVLGSMMSDASAIDDVIPILRGEMFLLPSHQKLYSVLIDLHAANKPIDLVCVTNELRHRGDLEAVGGQDYMIQLADSYGDWALADHYARIVLEKHRLRELIRIGDRMSDAAYVTLADSESVLSDAVGKLEELSQQRCAQHVSDAVDLVAAVPGETQAGKGRIYVTTGLIGLDDAIGGLERGGLTVIGARPSVGKTSLGLSFALAASAAGIPALFVSVEMPARAIAQRIMSSVGNEPMQDIRFTLGSEALERIAHAVVIQIGRNKLFIASKVNDSRDIAALVRAMVRKYGVGLAVIDYLQLCRGPRSETRNIQIADMTGTFKRLAMDSDLAVVLLSQLNRGSAKDGETPDLPNLRDSGAIEQDADVVGLLMRDAASNKAARERSAKYPLTLKIAKNRNGELRQMELMFHPRTMTFSMGAGQWTEETPF